MVVIEMDKQRHLKFGINAMIELEKITGKPLTNFESGFSIADLRSTLYVGLKWEDKSLNEEIVGDLMDDYIQFYGMEDLSKKLGEAMSGAFGGVETPSK